jgi:hypothetical protein
VRRRARRPVPGPTARRAKPTRKYRRPAQSTLHRSGEFAYPMMKSASSKNFHAAWVQPEISSFTILQTCTSEIGWAIRILKHSISAFARPSSESVPPANKLLASESQHCENGQAEELAVHRPTDFTNAHLISVGFYLDMLVRARFAGDERPYSKNHLKDWLRLLTPPHGRTS